VVAIATLSIAVAAFGLVVRPPNGRQSVPDVVLISLDTVRADRVSALFPIERDTTPNLASLPGARFRNCWAHAPYTSASHASLFSGQYKSAVHYGVAKRYFAAAERVLPEILRDAGYYTAAITAGGFMGKRWGSSRGFTYFDEAANWEIGEEVDLTRRWLERWAHKRFAKRGAPPLFLFVHTFLAHEPYLSERWGTKMPDRYDADIREADRIVGVVWDAMKRLRARSGRSFVVIVTADHGEEMGEHGRWGRHAKTLHREVLHVPLVWVEPGLPLRMIDERVALIDVVPTLLERLGIAVPPDVDGISLLPLVNTGAWKRPERILFSMRHVPPEHMGYRATADEGSYIEDVDVPIAYFAADDMAERHNIWNPTNVVQDRLARATEEFRSRWRAPNAPETTFDPVTRMRLEALGYVLGPPPGDAPPAK
jgi:arylsulfatase A-like enzyme